MSARADSPVSEVVIMRQRGYDRLVPGHELEVRIEVFKMGLSLPRGESQGRGSDVLLVDFHMMLKLLGARGFEGVVLKP